MIREARLSRRIAQLYTLLGRGVRAELAVAAFLLVMERVALAAGVIGASRELRLLAPAAAAVVALWTLRGFLRQRATADLRRRLTMLIAETALQRGASRSLLPGEEADAAVFEGRYAAEQVLIVHVPALFAEALAVAVLLLVVRPSGVPVAEAGATLAAIAVAFALLRPAANTRQKSAWSGYMNVARRSLTTLRAATEIVASGHERLHLDGLRTSIDEWTKEAARAERLAALFQRIPVAGVLALGAVLLVRMESFELGRIVRLAVLLPPLGGLARALFELLRTAPRLQTIAPVLDAAREGVQTSAGNASPPTPCEIRFDSVTFAYESEPVLRDVSFTWKPGVVLGIRGANGSGKSTLLKLMLGLLRPTSGEVLVDGVTLREVDLPSWRKNVSYLPQRPYVPDRSTVYEAMQVAVPGLPLDAARRALETTGTWDLLRRKSGTPIEPNQLPMASLSEGMRQRVLLSRAFVQTSGMILLDEPDENLDSQARTMLAQLVRDPRFMVAVATHDERILEGVDEIVDLADRSR
jgi:ABC-type multidrug transport system fused ATPase/permease subunit